MNTKLISNLAITGVLALAANSAFADCKSLPSYADLKTALQAAKGQENGGFGFNMWGTIVDRDGIVCAVAYTGSDRAAQWPGSRVISAQKANTANSFSLPTLALSTANLYSATQAGGTLFGLQLSNPVDTAAAYKGPSTAYGQKNDPLVGKKIGGVNVFGGGLALYNSAKQLVGAIGVSGDSSCADHNIAWRTRNNLKFDYVPGGVSGTATRPDNIVYDFVYTLDAKVTGSNGVNYTVSAQVPPGASKGGWGHPACNASVVGLAAALPTVP